jgi:hypothetical protein
MTSSNNNHNDNHNHNNNHNISGFRVDPLSPFRGIVTLDVEQAASLLATSTSEDSLISISTDGEGSASASDARSRKSRNPQEATIHHNQNRLPPLLPTTTNTTTTTAATTSTATSTSTSTSTTKVLRSRKTSSTKNHSSSKSKQHRQKHKHRRHRSRSRSNNSSKDQLDYLMDITTGKAGQRWKCCREHRGIVRSTLSCMNLVAKILMWCTAMASVAAVVWYTNELRNNG